MWFLVLVLVVLGFYFYKNKEFKLELNENYDLIYPDKRFGESLSSYQERIVIYQNEYLKYMKELEKQDNYGGKTPEETLELYIKALEARDFELASKYFVLEDQKKEFEELKSLDQNKIDSYLSVLNKANPTSYNSTFNTYELRSLFDGKDILVTGFVKNKETDIWKLESI